MCRETEVSGACDSAGIDSYTILVGSDDTSCNEYVLFPDSKTSHSV